MKNVLKKTIREEIEKFSKEKGEGSKSEGILPVNTIPANPNQKMKSKAPQTKRRLSNLLGKFRSKSCIRGSVKSSSKKMKKLQIKYIYGRHTYEKHVFLKKRNNSFSLRTFYIEYCNEIEYGM